MEDTAGVDAGGEEGGALDPEASRGGWRDNSSLKTEFIWRLTSWEKEKEEEQMRQKNWITASVFAMLQIYK